jgi:hypothetical protein
MGGVTGLTGASFFLQEKRRIVAIKKGNIFFICKLYQNIQN